MNDTMPTENDSAAPAAESTDEFDYDGLLKEYDEGKTSQPQPEPAARPDPAVRELLKEFKPIAQYAEHNMRSEAAKQEQELVQQAISTVKEEGELSTVPDTIVEAYLNLQYAKNPEFKAAFEGRSDNPGSWTSALVKARDSLSSDIGSMSKSSDKDDTEAALATVRGTSQTEIDDALDVKPKDLFAMSDQAYAEFKRNLGS